MINPVREMSTTPEELAEVASVLSKAAHGLDSDTVIMACLALVIINQRPSLSFDQLTGGVRGMSEWLTLYLSSLDDVDLPKEQVN